MLYIVLYIILLLSSFSKKYNILLLWLNIIILSSIAGLRDITIGIDTVNYYDIYTTINSGISSYIEPGWQLLNKLAYYLGGFNLLLWIVALLTLIPIGIISQKLSPNPSLSLFIYYCLYAYLNSFNIMRQIFATSIVFMAYYAYYNRQRLKTLCYLALGMSVHMTSILGIAVFFIKFINITKKKVLLYCSLSLLVGIIINNNILSFILGPYADYLNSNSDGYRENPLSSFILALVVNLIFYLIIATSKKEIRDSQWYKLYFIGILMMNASFQLELGTRAILFFTLLQFIVYPLYFRNNIIKNKIIVFSIILLYITAIFLKILILGNNIGEEGSIIPYKVFFHKML